MLRDRIRKEDAVAVAIAAWGASVALPELLWLLKHDCLASCIETFPGSGDIQLITDFSADIATQGAIFSHPDPFLRYIPIAVAIVVGKVVGPFEPVVVTVGYTFVWEFFILPVSLYLAVRWVADGWAGALAVGLLIFTTQASLVAPWPGRIFGAGNYQYALAVPSALLALGATAWDDRGLWVGALLGVTANIQIAIAALAALTVAARYALAERWRQLASTAGISFILTLPTFLIYATSYTAGQTQQRALRLSGLLTVLGLLIIAGIIVYLLRTEHKLTDLISEMPFAVMTAISAVAVIAGLVEGYWWYPFVGGYIGHITLAGALAIRVTRRY